MRLFNIPFQILSPFDVIIISTFLKKLSHMASLFRALCRTFKFFHSNLGSSCLHEAHFLHTGFVVLEQDWTFFFFFVKGNCKATACKDILHNCMLPILVEFPVYMFVSTNIWLYSGTSLVPYLQKKKWIWKASGANHYALFYSWSSVTRTITQNEMMC